MIVFGSRQTVPDGGRATPATFTPALSSDAYHDAQSIAPGWDVYYLEREWREWTRSRHVTRMLPLSGSAASGTSEEDHLANTHLSSVCMGKFIL